MNYEKIVDQVCGEITLNKSKVDNPTVIALVGLQYSGKSTIANMISQHNYAHYWATKIKKEYNIANEQMLEIAGLVVRKLVSDGYNVVIDYVNHKFAMRQSLRDIVSESSAHYKLVYLDIKKEERHRRREVNIAEGETAGRRIISLEQMQEFEDNFDIPSLNENPIVLKTQEDINSFIASL